MLIGLGLRAKSRALNRKKQECQNLCYLILFQISQNGRLGMGTPPEVRERAPPEGKEGDPT